jgi:hypothetical protein
MPEPASQFTIAIDQVRDYEFRVRFATWGYSCRINS